MQGLPLVAASGGHSSSRCAGLSVSRPLLLWSTGSRCTGSVVVAHGPSRSAACGNPPRPGLEPVSPALAGRFSTTAPPGKPPFHILSSGQFTFIDLLGSRRSLGTESHKELESEVVNWPTQRNPPLRGPTLFVTDQSSGTILCKWALVKHAAMI